MKARIIGTGSYTPGVLITNEELGKRLGQPISKNFEEKVGIRQRYITGPDESSADLGYKAALNALDNAGIRAKDLDLIIVASDTPEYISPPTSCVIQGRLEAFNAGVFDLNASCAGFVTALDVASRKIMADGSCKNVLVIGVYNMSKYVDWTDRNICTIFADGGGAVVMQAALEEGAGFLKSKLIADGTQYDFLGIYAGGTKYPITRERLDNKEHLLQSLKPLPPDRNLEKWPGLVREVIAGTDYKVEDIDLAFFTQINRSVIHQVMDRLGLAREKAPTIMEEYGYTGSACIPMALDITNRAGKISRGDLLVFVGSGVGYSMAAASFIW